MLRDILLYIHILSVIVSLGPFFVMFPVMSAMRAAEFPQLSQLITTFRFAVRLSKHAGHVLVATGALLVWETGYRWEDSWMIATLLVLLASLIFMARAFSPTLRKLAKPEHEADRTILIRKLYRAVWIYIGLLLILLWLMVDKPTLW